MTRIVFVVIACDDCTHSTHSYGGSLPIMAPSALRHGFGFGGAHTAGALTANVATPQEDAREIQTRLPCEEMLNDSSHAHAPRTTRHASACSRQLPRRQQFTRSRPTLHSVTLAKPPVDGRIHFSAPQSFSCGRRWQVGLALYWMLQFSSQLQYMAAGAHIALKQPHRSSARASSHICPIQGMREPLDVGHTFVCPS